MSRLLCGQSSDSDGRDLLYAGPVQHAGPHHSTALMGQERGAGWGAAGSGRRRRITVDRADSEPEPRCTVGGWVTIRGQSTILTELCSGISDSPFYKGSGGI
jgi:hypothetical protein